MLNGNKNVEVYTERIKSNWSFDTQNYECRSEGTFHPKKAVMQRTPQGLVRFKSAEDLLISKHNIHFGKWVFDSS